MLAARATGCTSTRIVVKGILRNTSGPGAGADLARVCLCDPKRNGPEFSRSRRTAAHRLVGGGCLRKPALHPRSALAFGFPRAGHSVARLALNFTGDGFRDLTDPRRTRR